MSEERGTCHSGLEGVNPNRLFLGSCLSLIATAVAFGAVTGMTEDFKTVFSLSNTQTGWVGGAALWGFAISIWVFGPLCDAIGMARLMRLSLICHLVGPLLMIFAKGFGMLYAGALIIAFGQWHGRGRVQSLDCHPLSGQEDRQAQPIPYVVPRRDRDRRAVGLFPQQAQPRCLVRNARSRLAGQDRLGSGPGRALRYRLYGPEVPGHRARSVPATPSVTWSPAPWAVRSFGYSLSA